MQTILTSLLINTLIRLQANLQSEQQLSSLQKKKDTDTHPLFTNMLQYRH